MKVNLRKLDRVDRLTYYILLTIGTIVIPFLVSGIILPLTNWGFDRAFGYTILLGILMTNVIFAQVFIRLTIWTNLIIGVPIGLGVSGLTYLISKMIITEKTIVLSITIVSVIFWELIYHVLSRKN
jgi:hypothetical protein